jgi:pyruvate-formate lyase-activating enzyme
MTQASIDRSIIEQCLGDGAEGVDQMIADVKGLTTQFRERDTGAGNYGLAQLAHNLKALIVLVQTLRGPISEIQPPLVAALPTEQDVETLGSWLESLVEAQAGQDWLTVADVLEFDLEPTLRAWMEQLQVLQRQCAA